MTAWRIALFRGILTLGMLLPLMGCRTSPTAGAATPTGIPHPTNTASPSPLPTSPPTPSTSFEQVALLGRGAPRALAWSPDGERLAIGSAAGVYLYAPAGEVQPLFEADVTTLAWSLDGQTLAWGTTGGETLLWDVNEHAVRNRLTGRQVSVTAIAFATQGSLAIGYSDGTLEVWHTPTGEVRGPFVAHTSRLTALTYCGLLPDTQRPALFTAGRDGSLVLWDGLSGDLRTTLRLSGTALLSLACDSSSGQVFSATADGVIQVWGPQGQIARYGALADIPVALATGLNETLAAGDKHGGLWLWENLQSAPARHIQAHAGRVVALAYQPKQDTLASLGEDGMLYLWNGSPRVNRDTTSPQPRASLTGFAGRVQMALLWDTRLLSAHADGTLRLWDTENYTLLSRMTGHQGAVNALTRAGDVIVSGGMDGTLRLWSLDGKPLGVWYAHRSWVSALTFAGDWLVSAAGDSTLAVWREGVQQSTATLPAGVWATKLLFQPPDRVLVLRSDGQIMACQLPALHCSALPAMPSSNISTLVRASDTILALDGQGQVWEMAGEHWHIVPLPARMSQLFDNGLALSVEGEIWQGLPDEGVSLMQIGTGVTWIAMQDGHLYSGFRSGQIGKYILP